MSAAEIIMCSISGAGFVLTLLGIATLHGRHAQKIESLEGGVKGLDVRMTAVESLKVSVEGLTQSVEYLGERMADSQKLAASEMGRLADAMAAGHKLMESQLAGFKQMTDRELGELKENVRAVRNALDEQRSFAPGGSTRRKVPAG